MKLFIVILFAFPVLVGCSNNKGSFLYPDCGSSDIEMLDTCLLNTKLKDAIAQLKIDTSQIHTFDEPPGILRGIVVTTDSSNVTLYTTRKSIVDTIGLIDYKLYYTLILDSAIIGVSWEKPKSRKKKVIGSIIW